MTIPADILASYRKQREHEKAVAEARANQTGEGRGYWQERVLTKELNDHIACQDAQLTHLGSITRAAKTTNLNHHQGESR